MKFKANVEVEVDDKFYWDEECIETMIRGRINGGCIGLKGVSVKAFETKSSKPK